MFRLLLGKTQFPKRNKFKILH